MSETPLFDLTDYPATPKPLHIFVREEGGCGDICIAHDAPDAVAVLEEAPGELIDSEDFDQHPDDQPFEIVDVDEPGSPTISKLPAEWIAENRRGYLGGWA